MLTKPKKLLKNTDKPLQKFDEIHTLCW